MSKSQRIKGLRGQQEAAKLLNALMPGCDWHSGAQARSGGDSPDLVDASGNGSELWIEVKRRKRCNIKAALAQAREHAGVEMPVAMTRDDGGQWLLTIYAEDLPFLINLLRKMI